MDRPPLEGDIPSQIDTPSGCPFHPRCPRYLGEVCRQEMPPWQENQHGDRILCHIPLDELAAAQRKAENYHSSTDKNINTNG